MRKTVFGCLGAAAIAFALQFTPAYVHAAPLFGGCAPCDEVGCFDESTLCDPCDAVCGPKAGKWFLSGHLEAGFFANSYGATNAYGEEQPWGNSYLLQNTKHTGFQANQVYLSAGRAVDGRRGLDIGGQVDFTWGSDAWIAQSAGLETGTTHNSWYKGDYYSAFAQAYGEVAYGKLNVIAGKFYTPFGTSSYKSTDNFFYSWAPTTMIVPTTGGGAYASYKASDRFTLLGGWVMPDEIGESSQNNAVFGGATWTPGERFSLSYTLAIGKDKYNKDPAEDVFIHTLLATTKLSKRLTYVFEWSLSNTNADDAHAAAYGLNNEVIYQLNKKWALGTRFGLVNVNTAYIAANEDEDNPAKSLGTYFTAPGDWYFVSIGANWTPNKWLTVKPEIRYDWMDPTDILPFKAGAESAQFSGGVSAVVKF